MPLNLEKMAKVLEKFTEDSVIIEFQFLDGKPFITILYREKVICALPPEEILTTKYDVRDYVNKVLDKVYKEEKQ